MRTIKLLFIAILSLSVFASCEKNEEKTISEQVSGSYLCRLGNTSLTVLISKQSDNQVNISLNAPTKSQIVFSNVTVSKKENEVNSYELSHTEIINGEITYFENGKSFTLSIEWADGKITGYKNTINISVAKEISGIYEGNIGDIAVNAELTESTNELINIRLYSSQPDFTTINLNNITVEKFVFDTLGNPSIHFDLKNHSEIFWTAVNFYESENSYRLMVDLIDGKYYSGKFYK